MSIVKKVFSEIQIGKRSVSQTAKKYSIPEKTVIEIRRMITKAIRINSKNILKTVQEIYDGKDVTANSESNNSVTSIHEDLDKGECRITGISTSEPKSPEEIISVLNIDTSKWKLSQYWNKESAGGLWTISALVSKIKVEEATENSFLEKLQSIKVPRIPRLSNPKKYNSNLENVAGLISLQDLHFGKPGNENMDEIAIDAVTDLFSKAVKNYNLELGILVIGPDTLNMDTFNGTTTKGTPVENSQTATEAYLQAFEAGCKIIGLMAQQVENLDIIFIPGNHDRLSSFHLIHALSQSFKDWKNINFQTEYQERKVVSYGLNMLGFEHGDVTTKNNPLVYAVEFPAIWGEAKYRMLYTGHYHGRKTKEFVTENEEHGFVTRVIPALTSSDYYHYHNKYIGNNRSALLHIHHPEKGLVAEYTYSV